jgi:vancomycin permeability regulator SanA
MRNIIKRILLETLEDKWNPKDGMVGYDYQHGFCHYFAYNIIGKIRKKFPKKKVNYYLLLAQEVDKESGEPINDYLIHVYIKIDDMLLDSNGFTTKDKALHNAKEWEERQQHLIPDEYETVVWDEESDEIPDIFFNNSFCNSSKVKKDIDKFLSNPVVQRILRDK